MIDSTWFARYDLQHSHRFNEEQLEEDIKVAFSQIEEIGFSVLILDIPHNAQMPQSFIVGMPILHDMHKELANQTKIRKILHDKDLDGLYRHAGNYTPKKYFSNFL